MRSSRVVAASVAAFAVAGGLAGGGIVWARTAASQIDACVETRTGYVVIGRACAGQPLSWSSEGPPGPRGEPGPAGAPGAPGPPGTGLEPRPASQDELKLRTAPPAAMHKPPKLPAKLLPKFDLPNGQVGAWSVWHDQKIDVPNILASALNPGSAWGVVAAHLEVPAGKYVVTAKASVFRNVLTITPAEVNAVSCSLVAGADFDSASAAEWNTLALNVVHSFAKPGRIELRCSSWGLVPLVLEDVKVTAIRVAALKNAYVDAGPLLMG